MEVRDRLDRAACRLIEDDQAARRERWLRLSDRALCEKEPTDRGVRLRFRRLAGVEDELRELAALERECCSFASWSVRREGDDVVLRVSAEGTSAATVRAMFDEPPPAPADAGDRAGG
jgi:hypothetical protein